MKHGALFSAASVLLAVSVSVSVSVSSAHAQTALDEPAEELPAPALPAPASVPASLPTETVEPAAPPEPAPRKPAVVEVVSPAPAPSVAVLPSAAVDVKPAEPPRQLSIGKEGFWKPGAVVQVWAFATHSEEEWKQTSFRLRRLELRWAGEIIPGRFGYAVVIDPARLLEPSTANVPVKNEAGDTIGTAAVSQPTSASSIVQDAVVTVMSDYVDVSIGQFKIPVSYEAYGSVAKLLLPERSTVSRRLGERRDIGIRAEKRLKYLGYVAAAMNGEGQNRLDTNDQKDLALRLELYPIEGLTLAGVGYSSVGERDLAGTKDRVEVDLHLEKAGFLLQGELIRGRDRVSATSRLTSQGYYAVLGYTIAKTLQPLVRFGYFDPNVRQSEEAPADFARLDEQHEYSGGLTYYWVAHEAKLQLATSVFDYDQAPTEVTTIFCAQASF
ncbi:MAG: hypothetical protein EOO73_33715 [Myxococcales bacterium]|nr:MAG: hypothetical protein EOO73_33715 [Myxococcales bacterium]